MSIASDRRRDGIARLREIERKLRDAVLDAKRRGDELAVEYRAKEREAAAHSMSYGVLQAIVDQAARELAATLAVYFEPRARRA